MTPQELVDVINVKVRKVEPGLPVFLCKVDLSCISCAIRKIEGDVVNYLIDDIREKRKVMSEKYSDYAALELVIQSIENNYVRLSYTAYRNYNDE